MAHTMQYTLSVMYIYIYILFSFHAPCRNLDSQSRILDGIALQTELVILILGPHCMEAGCDVRACLQCKVVLHHLPTQTAPSNFCASTPHDCHTSATCLPRLPHVCHTIAIGNSYTKRHAQDQGLQALVHSKHTCPRGV